MSTTPTIPPLRHAALAGLALGGLSFLVSWLLQYLIILFASAIGLASILIVIPLYKIFVFVAAALSILAAWMLLRHSNKKLTLPVIATAAILVFALAPACALLMGGQLYIYHVSWSAPVMFLLAGLVSMILVTRLLVNNQIKLIVLACLLVASIGLFVAAPFVRANIENTAVAKKYVANIPYPIFLPPANSKWTQPSDIIISNVSKEGTKVTVEGDNSLGGRPAYEDDQTFAFLNFRAMPANLKLSAHKKADCTGNAKDNFGDPLKVSCQKVYDANGTQIYLENYGQYNGLPEADYHYFYYMVRDGTLLGSGFDAKPGDTQKVPQMIDFLKELEPASNERLTNLYQSRLKGTPLDAHGTVSVHDMVMRLPWYGEYPE